jgi:hypothetical protein
LPPPLSPLSPPTANVANDANVGHRHAHDADPHGAQRLVRRRALNLRARYTHHEEQKRRRRGCGETTKND